jgi:hypothetical protein
MKKETHLILLLICTGHDCPGGNLGWIWIVLDMSHCTAGDVAPPDQSTFWSGDGRATFLPYMHS